jgi:hypothetical protein
VQGNQGKGLIDQALPPLPSSLPPSAIKTNNGRRRRQHARARPDPDVGRGVGVRRDRAHLHPLGEGAPPCVRILLAPQEEGHGGGPREGEGGAHGAGLHLASLSSSIRTILSRLI